MNGYPLNFLICFLLLIFTSLTLVANPYSVLGISPDSSDEEVLNAYREKAKQTHPDKSSLPATEAAKQFKKIQAAFEEIKKLRSSARLVTNTSPAENLRRQAEKAAAKTAATNLLEKAWTTHTFSQLNLSDLPVISKLTNSRIQFAHGRGPKEEGEWEAVREFLAAHQLEYLKSNPPTEKIFSLLRDIELYMDYNGQTVKDIRSGFAEPIEDWLFNNTTNKDQFLDTLAGRFRRLSRAGAFPLSRSTPEERAKLFGGSLKKYEELFVSNESSEQSLASQLAGDLIQSSLKKIDSNPFRLNELEFLFRSVPAALDQEEKLKYLGDLKIQIESLTKQKNYGTVRDFSSRLDKAIQKVFDKNPDLKIKYSQKSSLLNRISGKVSQCEILLGKLSNSR